MYKFKNLKDIFSRINLKMNEKVAMGLYNQAMEQLYIMVNCNLMRETAMG